MLSPPPKHEFSLLLLWVLAHLCPKTCSWNSIKIYYYLLQRAELSWHWEGDLLWAFLAFKEQRKVLAIRKTSKQTITGQLVLLYCLKIILCNGPYQSTPLVYHSILYSNSLFPKSEHLPSSWFSWSPKRSLHVHAFYMVLGLVSLFFLSSSSSSLIFGALMSSVVLHFSSSHSLLLWSRRNFLLPWPWSSGIWQPGSVLQTIPGAVKKCICALPEELSGYARKNMVDAHIQTEEFTHVLYLLSTPEK